ncbi:MAG: HypC/HybG/HupF family hydrogenase formation chaperone [Phycisphaerae bacterium]|nr:HypC/HybG/HupF family hydrogenase formation chaperone [Phycisphaerae bacterium]
MCLAIPAKIESIHESWGTVALAGSRTRANLMLVPEARVGDWVLVHAGFAITVIQAKDARQTYELLAQMDPPDAERPK